MCNENQAPEEKPVSAEDLRAIFLQSLESQKLSAIAEDKTVRKELDEILQRLKGFWRQSREREMCIVKITEAIMWAGMDLKALNEGRTIYPESYNPGSPVVEPPADGLKM